MSLLQLSQHLPPPPPLRGKRGAAQCKVVGEAVLYLCCCTDTLLKAGLQHVKECRQNEAGGAASKRTARSASLCSGNCRQMQALVCVPAFHIPCQAAGLQARRCLQCPEILGRYQILARSRTTQQQQNSQGTRIWSVLKLFRY